MKTQINLNKKPSLKKLNLGSQALSRLLKGLCLLMLCLAMHQASFGQYNNVVYTSPSGSTGGSHNSFFGYDAGNVNTGSNNSFLGYQAGYYNTTGGANNFTGYQAGYCNTTGSSNNFIGYRAGYSNTTGQGNNFTGYHAGYANTTANYNNFVGYQAGYSNTTGSGNNFSGFMAGYENTTGNDNTFIGYGAGSDNQTGSGNVFVGYKAGDNETGSNKLYIDNSYASSPLIWGDFANNLLNFNGKVGIGTKNPFGQLDLLAYKEGTSGSAVNSLEHQLVLGGNYNVGPNVDGVKLWIGGYDNEGSTVYPIYVEDENNNVDFWLKNRLSENDLPTMYFAGNMGIGTTNPGTYELYVNGDAYATGTWTSSDERFKENLQKVESAFDKINQLEGLTYQFKTQSTEFAERNFPQGKQYGFSAQKLQKVLPELVKEGEDGYLAVNYTGVIPVLVEALKEKDAQIKDLEARFAKLEASVLAQSTQKVGISTEIKSEISIVGASLAQNQPNPFSEKSLIRYTLPEATQTASILIYDMQGSQVKVFENLSKGSGSLEIQASSLKAGMYLYTLVVDGKEVDTKRMILMK